MFASLTGILFVIACLRYEFSIVLPESDREAANLFGLCVLITFIITLVTIPIAWFCGPQIFQFIQMPNLIPYLWLVPIAILLQGIFTTLNYWNIRTKRFSRLSIAQVTNACTTTSVQVGAGIAGHASGSAMISASVAGKAFATAMLSGQVFGDNGKFLLNSITWREMLKGLKRHKRFPVYSSLGGLLNTASWQLPALLLGTFFSRLLLAFTRLALRFSKCQ